MFLNTMLSDKFLPIKNLPFFRLNAIIKDRRRSTIMKKIGIIVEYNPLHNGHLYHLAKIRELANPSMIIAVCSSTFTMRGDLSMFDKFTKTTHALKAGIDLVIELPAVLAVNHADIFAYHAVLALTKAHVDELWIGSEENNIERFANYLKLENDPSFQALCREKLKKGLSYKVAYNLALEANQLTPLESNDTLGFSYYKALKKLNSAIQLKSIQRIGDHDNDKIISSSYPSATAIRNHFEKQYVPDYVFQDYENKFLSIDDLFPYFIFILQRDDLTEIFFNEEGLSSYLKKYTHLTSYQEFISTTATKRYSASRIKRFIFYALFRITKEDIKKIREKELSFLRILGTNEIGLSHLKEIKKEITIYTNIKEGLDPILDFEIKITKILDSIYHQDLLKKEQNLLIKKER